MQHILFDENESGGTNPPEPDLDTDLADFEAFFAATTAEDTTTSDDVEATPLAVEPAMPLEEAPEVEALAPPIASTMVVPAAPHSRRGVRIVAVGAVVALIAGVSVWGWTQHSSAADWKAQAGQLDAQLTSTRADLKSTEATLTKTENDLDASKKQLDSTKTQLTDTKTKLTDTNGKLIETKSLLSDVRAQLSEAKGQLTSALLQVDDLTAERDSLTAQVGTLANDKAQIEDEREQLTAVLATAPAMTAALRACVASSTDVSLELLKVIELFPYRSLDKAGRLVDDMTDACNNAFAKTDAFDSTLSNLGV